MSERVIQMPKVTKDKEKSTGRALVYQGNPLIQSRKYFDTIGMRLFILALMTLNPHLSKRDKYFDKKFPDVHISTSEITRLFGNTFYLKKLQEECEKLFNSSITLDYKNGGWEFRHIFDVMKYVPNDGLYMRFDESMRPYVLDLVEGGYTAINIEQIFQLTSTYAVRLLELCLQYRNMTQKGDKIKRELTIDELRFYLNVPDNAYEGRMNNFKEKVLDEPMKEIAAKTDFRMSYSVVKEGRRVKSFVLELDLSQVQEDKFKLNCTVVDRPTTSVYGTLMRQGFSDVAARDILAKVGDNAEVERRLNYALKKLENRRVSAKVKNKPGYIRTAILKSWGEGGERKVKVAAEKPAHRKTPLELEDEKREAVMAEFRMRKARGEVVSIQELMRTM